MDRPIYPPRPGRTLPPSALETEDWTGWVAQPKYNGTRVVIYRHEEGSAFHARTGGFTMLNRHKRPLADYQPSPELRESLLRLPPGIYDGELLHHKTPDIKHRVMLWDLLGPERVGMDYGTRDTDLLGIFLDVVPGPAVRLASSITPAISLAEAFRSITAAPEIEGFVMKRLDAPLERPIGENNNGSWQVRIRRPAPNYAY